MNRTINIICKLNTSDDFSITSPALEINLTNKDKYHYTFWDTDQKHNRDLKLLPNFYSNEGLDLLYISLFVYFADRRITREMFPDAWTREIKLYIPVLSKKWESQKKLIEEMLSFLSGDIWEIEFRERSLNEFENKFQKKIERNISPKLSFKKISMLSGGLDSFVGAIDLLEKYDNLLFVNHYGGGPSAKKYIEKVSELLNKEYKNKKFKIFKFHAAPLQVNEDTTRTRSLMFFAHAIVLATALNRKIDLIIPENGLISLNVPLTNSRLSSSSTRTTHPYYINLLQELLLNLDIKVNLKNPYQFKTKGEMIKQCKNKTFLNKYITDTMSCSHPDYGRYLKESKPRHCGICLPCIIRRAGIKKAGVTDKTDYRFNDFSTEQAKTNLKVYKLGIEKYKNATNKAFYIQKSGPITNDVKKYIELYNRGIEELKEFLNGFDK